MSRVLVVAWRDFKQTVARKAFLIAIVAIPVLIVGAIALAAVVMVGHEQPPLVGTVAIVDASGQVAEAARREFDPTLLARKQKKRAQELQDAGEQMITGGSPTIDPNMANAFEMGMGTGVVDVSIEEHATSTPELVDELRERVRTADLLAAAVIPPVVLETPDPGLPRKERPTFELLVGQDMDDDHAAFIERQVGDAVVRVRAVRADLDPDEAMAMLQRPQSSTRRVLASGEEKSEDADIRELKMIVPMLFMGLLFAGVFTGGQHLMMSTIEEKSNRVMEVLLSAVSPLQLMLGKLIAQCAVGLLLVSIYGSLIIAALIFFAFTQMVELTTFIYLVIYFFMAYFMVASIMGAVGSAVTDVREANTLITPVMVAVWIPWILWMPISQAPNGGVAIAFSFIPPAVPFVMILRLAADEPVPFWQIVATIVWGYVCVLGMVWMAAKIFRVGVLMYGKPPSPVQLLKWIRYA